MQPKAPHTMTTANPAALPAHRLKPPDQAQTLPACSSLPLGHQARASSKCRCAFVAAPARTAASRVRAAWPCPNRTASASGQQGALSSSWASVNVALHAAGQRGEQLRSDAAALGVHARLCTTVQGALWHRTSQQHRSTQGPRATAAMLPRPWHAKKCRLVHQARLQGMPSIPPTPPMPAPACARLHPQHPTHGKAACVGSSSLSRRYTSLFVTWS